MLQDRAESKTELVFQANPVKDCISMTQRAGGQPDPVQYAPAWQRRQATDVVAPIKNPNVNLSSNHWQTLVQGIVTAL